MNRYCRLSLLLILFVAWMPAAQSNLQEPAVITETVTHPFPGVRLIQRTQTAPEHQVCFIVEIALDAPGIRFQTTEANPPEAARETWCETTRDFVTRLGAQIGINGNYFIYDEQEHTELLGLAVSNGEVVSPWDTTWARFAVNIDKDNRVTFVERPENGAGTSDTIPETNLYNALSGSPMLLRDGKIQTSEGGDRHPRTGIGITADNKLLLLAADGRQPGYSAGMTFHEMAVTMKACGAVEALALDGGGSTTLVVANPEPQVINVPTPATLPRRFTLNAPGIERRNGNNLAVFAPPADDRNKDRTE